MFAKQLKKDFAPVLKSFGLSIDKLEFEHPKEETHGDYSTNIALKVNREGLTSFELANKLVSKLREIGLPSYISKIDVVNPGFINIWIKKETLGEEALRVLSEKDKYGSNSSLKSKKILIEHTSPNPQTTIMLGHLRNNFLGMAVSRVLEFCQAEVKRDCVLNDRGVHLSRSLLGYLVFAKKGVLKEKEILEFKKISEKRIREVLKGKDWKALLLAWSRSRTKWYNPSDLSLKPDHLNLVWYVLGSRSFGFSEDFKKQVAQVLQNWEKGDKKLISLWKMIMKWAQEGYEQTYKRIGSEHDYFWKESKHFKKGKEMVEKGLEEKVFRKSEGAIVTDLKKFSLPDTVVAKSDGTALYFTQDLALTELKKKKFPSDLYIWVVGAEQRLYFKQLFAVCEQLGIVRQEKLFHLDYALINFKGGGKMSTRKGDVVSADEILDILRDKALKIIEGSNQDLRAKLSKEKLNKLAEEVGLSAAKYSLLRYGRDTVMQFDIDESLELEGNSSSYIQYTFARANSVLKKSDQKLKLEELNLEAVSEEEIGLLRTFYLFPEIVFQISRTYSLNLLCNYLFDLSQKFNAFYTNCPILGSENEVKGRRLVLSMATAQIIKNGIYLLGIKALERM